MICDSWMKGDVVDLSWSEEFVRRKAFDAEETAEKAKVLGGFSFSLSYNNLETHLSLRQVNLQQHESPTHYRILPS